MSPLTQPELKTDRLGGVDVPSAEVLEKMHNSPYILRARNGELSEVPAQKVLLPRERETSPQAVDAIRAPGGTIYAPLGHIICRSSDGGEIWTAHDKGEGGGNFAVLGDGRFVCLGSAGEHPREYVVVRWSQDEGRSWQDLAEISNPPGCWGSGIWILRLPDDGLVAAIGHPDHVFEEVDGALVHMAGEGKLWVYRSMDGGHTWSDPVHMVNDWASEGGVALTPSGRIFSVNRYQRPMLPGDPPDLEKRNGSISRGWPYKHICVVESDDQGRTWRDFRQLTTVFGQTMGRPVVQSDGTLCMVHDTRYGPGPAGSRGMISRDEGRTWEDEVYYLDYTTFVGSYNGSVALDDGRILTVSASSQAGNSWDAARNATDVYAIAWKPVKE